MIVLPEAQRDRIEAWVRAGYPLETCGLLVGRLESCAREAREAIGLDGADMPVAIVERVVQARNLNEERAQDRYELDPADFVATDHAARDDRLEIVGIWHSHPDSPARPSETDLRAAWPGWSYVIASVHAGGVRELRSWRLEEGAFREEKVRS